MIWIDTDQTLGRSSYYVQKMAAENRPTYNIQSNITMHNVEPDLFGKGYLGFGAGAASIEFKDIKVIRDGEVVIPDMSRFTLQKGEWKVNATTGNLSVNKGKLLLLKEQYKDDYTLECKVRKTEGEQGFQFFLGMNANGKTGYRYNIGMWSNNDRAELLRLDDGHERGVLTEHSGKVIEKNVWYDIKIVVSPMKSEFYIDGKLLLSYTSQPMPLQFIHTGYDEEKGEVVIKVVNAANAVYPTTISLEGARDVVKDGKIISLIASDGSDENSYEEPKKIYPNEEVYSGFSEKFDYEFLPFSYTVLRIKAKK